MFRIENCRIEKFIWCSENNIFKIEKMKLKQLKIMEIYKQKKISLGLASKLSGLTLSEFLDLLEEFNVKMNFTLEDAKEAMKNAEKLI